jgi:hypothetical protein
MGGIVLAAGYMLWMLQRVVLGQPKTLTIAQLSDLNIREFVDRLVSGPGHGNDGLQRHQLGSTYGSIPHGDAFRGGTSIKSEGSNLLRRSVRNHEGTYEQSRAMIMMSETCLPYRTQGMI